MNVARLFAWAGSLLASRLPGHRQRSHQAGVEWSDESWAARFATLAAWIEMWPRRAWRDCVAEYHDGLREVGLDPVDMVKVSLGLVAAATRIRTRIWYLWPKWRHVASWSVVAGAAATTLLVVAEPNFGSGPLPVGRAALASLLLAGICPVVAGMDLGLMVAAVRGRGIPGHRTGLAFCLLSIGSLSGITSFITVIDWDPIYFMLGIAAGASYLLAGFVGARFGWRLVTSRNTRQDRVKA